MHMPMKFKNSLKHFVFGRNICSFFIIFIFISITPEILVLGTLYFTHVHLSTMHMHINNKDIILSICHVTAIFIIFFTFMSIMSEILHI